ncbi:MAG: SH3 domain-containing protein [Cyanobacteria bacterium P01_A01_bin.68]
MNDLIQKKLCELVNIHGQILTNESQKCLGLLNDYSQQYPGDVFVLVSAVKEGIAAQLLNLSQNIPQEVLLGKLSKTLQDNLCLNDKAAQWSVESWAIALGIINKGEWSATSIKNLNQLTLEKIVQQKLCQIIKSYGKLICDETQRCEALLFDYCPQHRKEIILLINALKEGITTEVLKSSFNHKQLTKRLENNLYLDSRAAEWTVESWVIALGVEKNFQIPTPVIWPRKHNNHTSFSSQSNVLAINKWLLGFAICWAMGIAGYTICSIMLSEPVPKTTPSKSPITETPVINPPTSVNPPDPNCYVKIKKSANIRSKPASFLNNVVRTSTGEEHKVTGKYTPGGWIQVLLTNDRKVWVHLNVLDETKQEIFDCINNKSKSMIKVADIPLPKITQKQAKLTSCT